MRDIMKRDLRESIISRDKGCCVVCGYPFEAALVTHHNVPVEFGGTNDPSNLVLVCENCHKIIHIMSAKQPRLAVSASDFKEYGSYRKLSELAKMAQAARIGQGALSWREARKTRALTPLLEALDSIAKKNKYDEQASGELAGVVRLVVHAIPGKVVDRCSFRLIRAGRAMSVNMMNYVLFRVPALADTATTSRTNANCFLIWPGKLMPNRPLAVPGPLAYEFAHFDAVMVTLSFPDVLEFGKTEWREFAKACEFAATARRSRSWPSNVDPSDVLAGPSAVPKGRKSPLPMRHKVVLPNEERGR